KELTWKFSRQSGWGKRYSGRSKRFLTDLESKGRNVRPENSDLWDEEYSLHRVIPSSTREAPSHVLLLYSELLGFRNMRTALDAGCGNARNSVYLARMGIDIQAV